MENLGGDLRANENFMREMEKKEGI